MEPVIVREAGLSDLPAVARIHKDQFGDHLLGQYSVGTLTRFYESFLDGSLFLVAEGGGQIQGFVMGGEKAALGEIKNKFTSSHRVRLVLESLLRPKVWEIMTRRLFFSGSAGSGRSSDHTTRLLSVAVSEEAMGRGIAPSLVRAFEDRLGYGSWYGLSVLEDNDRAITFYNKNGFSEEFRLGHSVFFCKKIQGDEHGGLPAEGRNG